MTIHLPQPIAAYIAAENAHLPEAVAACFTEEATVRDEGKTVTGSAAIRDWKRATSENTARPSPLYRRARMRTPARWAPK